MASTPYLKQLIDVTINPKDVPTKRKNLKYCKRSASIHGGASDVAAIGKYLLQNEIN